MQLARHLYSPLKELAVLQSIEAEMLSVMPFTQLDQQRPTRINRISKTRTVMMPKVMSFCCFALESESSPGQARPVDCEDRNWRGERGEREKGRRREKENGRLCLAASAHRRIICWRVLDERSILVSAERSCRGDRQRQC